MFTASVSSPDLDSSTHSSLVLDLPALLKLLTKVNDKLQGPRPGCHLSPSSPPLQWPLMQLMAPSLLKLFHFLAFSLNHIHSFSSVAAITNSHKLSILKHCKFIVQFCRSEVQQRSHWLKSRCFLLEVLQETLVSLLLQDVGRTQSLWYCQQKAIPSFWRPPHSLAPPPLKPAMIKSLSYFKSLLPLPSSSLSDFFFYLPFLFLKNSSDKTEPTQITQDNFSVSRSLSLLAPAKSLLPH